MNAAAQIALALGSVAVLLALVALVRGLARRHGWPAELQRKLVHIGTGLFALSLPWIFAEDWPIYLLLGLSLGVMTGLRLARDGIGRALHGVARNSYGDYLLAASIGLLLLFSDRDMLLYSLPLAVLTLSDAAAALAGSAYGRRFFVVAEGRKSFEGSAMFFLVTLVIAMSVLILTQPETGLTTILLALLLALYGTQFEADSWRGFDNLFLPLGLMIILASHRDSPAETLLALALVLAAAVAAAPVLARWVETTDHVVRVYLVAFFLILLVTDWSNAVLPACVLAAHLATRRLAPSADPYPELDVVAALALVSFGWLAIGEGAGANALGFYAMTCAGLAAGLVVLSHRGAGVLSAAVLVGACAVFVPLSGRAEGAGLAALSFGAVALCVAATLGWPQAFRRLRMVKLTTLSAALPLVAYSVQFGGRP